MTEAERRFSQFIQDVGATTGNESNGVVRAIMIAGALAGAAAIVGSYGFGYAPRLPEGHILSSMAFFPAIVAASLFGRLPTWIAAAVLLLVEALYLPPGRTLWFEAQFVPWYIEYAISLCGVAILSTRRREPHAPDKSISQGKRLGVIRDRPPVLFAFSQNLIK